MLTLDPKRGRPAARRRKPDYSPCRFAIIYDPPEFDPAADWAVKPGHYTRLIPSEICHLVQAVRPSTRIPGRVNVHALRWPANEIPADARVHVLTSTKRKSRRRLSNTPKLLPT